MTSPTTMLITMTVIVPKTATDDCAGGAHLRNVPMVALVNLREYADDYVDGCAMAMPMNMPMTVTMIVTTNVLMTATMTVPMTD